MDNIRYLVLNKNKEIVYKYPWGAYMGVWDFTLPGPLQGGRIVDLHVLRVRGIEIPEYKEAK